MDQSELTMSIVSSSVQGTAVFEVEAGVFKALSLAEAVFGFADTCCSAAIHQGEMVVLHPATIGCFAFSFAD